MKTYEKPEIEIVEANLSTDYLQPITPSLGGEASEYSIGGDDGIVYESDFDNEGW